jgi:hypothetical protein
MNPAPLLLIDKIARVADALGRAAIPFAFGGAIARNYYTEPRLTRDMDIGIFLPPEEHRRVLAALSTLFPIPDEEQVRRDIADLLYTQRDRLDIAYIHHWLGYFFPPDETRLEGDPLRYDTRRTRFTDLLEAIGQYGRKGGE